MADTIALIGGDSLLGMEVREVFGESSLGSDLRLVAEENDSAGKLTEISGSMAFLAKLEPDAVEDAAVVILAGSAASSKSALETGASATIIDLTGYTEEQPDAVLRSPLAEGPDFRTDLTGPQVVAHASATAIAVVLSTLHRAAPVARAIVHIFEPASERGKSGVDELHEQAVSLLSLKPLPKKVFDAQIAFNLRPQWGEEAPSKLADVEERIERHLASLLERNETAPPMPSLRLLQAPVFHGYALSLWVEFEDSVDLSAVDEALTGDPIDLRGPGVEPPDNVGVAGQTGIAVGAVSPDRNNGNALWLWAAVDNLRLMAESAALIAREIL